MNRLLVLCALIAASAAALAPGFRARFGLEVFFGRNYFVALPQSQADAVSEGWDSVDRDSTLHLGDLLVMYCYSNRILCTLYDDTGYIAGIRISIPLNSYTNGPYDMKETGFTSWTTPIDEVDTEFWFLEQYFVDADFLATDSNDRIASRDSDKLLQAGGIWLQGPGDVLTFVSENEADMSSSDFTEQACILAMGTHYYGNMTADLSCTEAPMYPWFPLMHNDNIVGSGFMMFGKLEEDSTRDWFERPTKSEVQMIVPRGPECLYDLTEDTGVVTMHIYYVRFPLFILC